MPVDQEHIKSVVEKLNRQLPKLASKPQPKNVHQFRTHTRRLEAVLEEVAPEFGRNEKKLLKQLARLRRKAGRVRDLDVQVAAQSENPTRCGAKDAIAAHARRNAVQA